MKKLFFPAVAALALGLASCSSDNVTPDGGGQPAFAEGGYAKVAIALPTQNGDSRAADTNNDTGQGKFDDGLASEYKVYNAKLILFQGNTEDVATFHSAYTLPVSMEDFKDNPNQITATTKIVSKLNDGSNLHGNKLWALVVLNDNNLFEVNNSALTVNVGTSSTNFTGTIADLQSTVVKAEGSERYGEKFTNHGFLMLNAPLAKAAGGEAGAVPAAEVNTLTDFTGAVYKTEAEALQKSATEVFVERAVAKVTIDKNLHGTLATSGMQVDGAATPTANPEWAVEGWDLDVTNNSSYLVRNTKTSYAWNGLKAEGVANYRFIGDKKVKSNTNLYRTYWAIDPNYGALNGSPAYAFNSDLFSYVDPDHTAFSVEFGDDAPKYCFENTFDVAHQNKQETTRAIVKVKIGNNGTFYTINGDKSHLYTAQTLKNRVYAAILSEPKVVEWLKNNGGSSTEADHGIAVDGLNDTQRDSQTGQLTIRSFTVTSASGVSHEFALTEFYPTPGDKTFNDALGLGTILSYEGGYAYYPIRIKHFGDDLTPWNKNETTKPVAGGTTANTYPGDATTSANNYLGRYGVLRNNWYNITVTSISGLGDAVVPSVKGDATTDDDLYNYIAVRINILSWAKRQQNADL